MWRRDGRGGSGHFTALDGAPDIANVCARALREQGQQPGGQARPCTRRSGSRRGSRGQKQKSNENEKYEGPPTKRPRAVCADEGDKSIFCNYIEQTSQQVGGIGDVSDLGLWLLCNYRFALRITFEYKSPKIKYQANPHQNKNKPGLVI